MSIIAAVRSYLATYSELEDGAPVWVDFLGPQATEYAVVPLAGEKVVDRYLNGGSLREFPFAFRSMESTADDLERLENAGFYEAFSDWLESQTLAETLPDLGVKKTAVAIEATGWAYLYEEGKSDTAIYQINCRLEYEQEP